MAGDDEKTKDDGLEQREKNENLKANEKLKYEVEKLKAEVKILKNPLRQPTIWLTGFALIISLSGNYIQCNFSKNEEILSKVEVGKAEIKLYNTRKKKNEIISDINNLNLELNNLVKKLSAEKKELVKIKPSLDKKGKEKLDKISKTISQLQNSTEQTTIALKNSESSLKEDLLNTAKTKEIEGFQAMIDGNYDTAIDAFQTAENAYPSYHNVYELGRLLRINKEQMKNNPAKKKEIFKKIVKDYSWKAPPELFEKVKEIAEQ